MSKLKYILPLFFLFFLFFCGSAKAATLSNAKDTITTSRPSASVPLGADQAANATQVTVNIDGSNKSVFLASDSATIRPDTGETISTGAIVASMSAANTPSANKRIVYFTAAVSNAHHSGDPVTVPITAMHTVQFTTVTAVPASGKIVMQFPGSGDNTASPSATTFAFNGLASGQISYRLDGTRTCTFTISAPIITCTVDSGGSIAAGTTITFLIGCGDGSSTATTCTTQAPRLINPTKTATGGQGSSSTTADIWKIAVQTQDASSLTIDNSTVAVATIESVQVSATIDPTLTFTITGIGDGTAINTGNTTGCTNTETTNTGFASTATDINLGVLSSSQINIAAQRINITTNGAGGYTLSATSSGHLINPANGFFITDSTTPAVMTAGTPWFGIHACGLDVTAGTWGTGATGGGAGARYGWPTVATAVTLASDSSGPIDNSLVTGNGIVSVEYAATVNAGLPQGTYYSVITYVATPTF